MTDENGIAWYRQLTDLETKFGDLGSYELKSNTAPDINVK